MSSWIIITSPCLRHSSDPKPQLLLLRREIRLLRGREKKKKKKNSQVGAPKRWWEGCSDGRWFLDRNPYRINRISHDRGHRAVEKAHTGFRRIALSIDEYIHPYIHMYVCIYMCWGFITIARTSGGTSVVPWVSRPSRGITLSTRMYVCMYVCMYSTLPSQDLW
jgi:hypothetical protein